MTATDMPHMSWISPKLILLDGVLALLNVGAWGATVLTWANVNQLTSTGSTMAATGVSVATVLWIRKQSRAADIKEIQDNERHLMQMRNYLEVKRVGTVVDTNTIAMANEHKLNIGIRDLAKETLSRSPTLPEQAIEQDKVMANREEVRRQGKMADDAVAADVASLPAKEVDRNATIATQKEVRRIGQVVDTQPTV